MPVHIQQGTTAAGDLDGTYASPTFDLTNPHTWTGVQTFVAPVLGAAAATSLALTEGTTITNGITFGSDVSLYRSGAITLKTDGALYVVNTLYMANNTGFSNASTGSNAFLRMNNAGAILTRDIADANPSFIIQQVHASSTGDILQLKNNASTLFTVSQAGAVNSTGDITVPDEAYGSGWNGSLEVPTKNAIYDKIETIANDVLFDHFVDANNGTTVETDLYSDTLAAAQLSVNGQKVIAQYGGVFVGDATSTQQLKAYFGGSAIFDSGALGFGVGTTNWDLYITIIRVSSSVVRCSATLNTSFASLAAYAKYTEVTGLTLANTQILKITGTAAGATGDSNQITAKESFVEFKPAA